jgi:hypothetical protein
MLSVKRRPQNMEQRRSADLLWIDPKVSPSSSWRQQRASSIIRP